MKKKKIFVGLFAFVMMFSAMFGFGIKTSIKNAYATGPDTYVAGSELKVETLESGTTYFTTFAGGKYLHLDLIDNNHETNSVSANADMEYDETTGVLKIFDTENISSNFSSRLSIIATNESDANLTIKLYRSVSLRNFDFKNGDLTITSGEDVHNPRIGWLNKISINGKLTISGEAECYINPGSLSSLNSELNSWVAAGELELLDSASFYLRRNYSGFTCGLNVNYLTLNTNGRLKVDVTGNLSEADIVLYVAYLVNFTKCLYISLSSRLDTEESITNSMYLRNAVSSEPISGYSATINRVKSGQYDEYAQELYRKELFVGKLLDVSYNSNGGTGTMSNDEVVYGDKHTLPACTFTAPEGKQFAGWAVGSVDAISLKQANTKITIEEPTVIYAIWADSPKAFTSQPSNATKQVGQNFTATWTVDFDAVEYAVCFWNGSAWQELYHYDTQTTTAGTQMSYNITSDVAGEKRYTIDCYYDEFHCLTSEEFVITWETASAVDPEPQPEPEQPENPESPTTNGGLSAGAVVGIVVASVVVVGCGTFALVWFVIKKKTWADFVALFKKK